MLSPDAVPSRPDFANGPCPSCHTPVQVEIGYRVTFDNNELVQCSHCGTRSQRQDIILEALAIESRTEWGLFASNFWIGGKAKVSFNDPAVYDLSPLQQKVVEWHHHHAFVEEVEQQLEPSVNRTDDKLIVGVFSPLAASSGNPQPSMKATVQWWQFVRLATQPDVPVWRQALFGAVKLIDHQPAAAIVMLAAGFEAFFINTVQIKWHESGLDQAAFRSLNKNVQSTTRKLDWLPRIVGLESIPAAIRKDWDESVNKPRNAVLYQGTVSINVTDARGALRATLKAIVAIDSKALVRPHAYWTGTQQV